MSTTQVERELTVQDYGTEPHLQDELTWGISYREAKVGEQSSPIKQKASPINVPFKLCRAAQKRHKKPKKICKCASHPPSTTPQLSLMGRSILTQDKYMDMLSIPNQTSPNKTKSKKKKLNLTCCKCKIEPCPPRLVQMALPKKRRVLENWKLYENILPTEMLMRFDQILKSGANLEPRDARYYFKKLKRKERKELKKKKKLCKKLKKQKKKGEDLWLKIEILELVDAIVNYIKEEPLFMLNFHQMMTSDELLRYLKSQRVVKIKTRNTKNVYKKSVIEISDKLVKWMDTMSFFADIQPVDSKEIVLEIPSLESLLEEEEVTEEEEGEEEGEGEEEEEGEEYRKKLREEQELEDLFGEDGILATDADQEAFMARKLLDKKDAFLEDEGEGSVYDMLKNLDEDILQKLIQILDTTPQDILSEEIDGENLPGVSYADILQKLKEIRDGNLLQQRGNKIFLEEKMVEWAKNNDPESIDDRVLDKIHETSTILSEWFKNVGVGDFKPQVPQKQELDVVEEEAAPGEGGEVADDTGLQPVEEIFEKKQEGEQLQAAPPIHEEDEAVIEGIETTEEGGAIEGEEPLTEGENLAVEDSPQDVQEDVSPGGGEEFPEATEGESPEAEAAEAVVPEDIEGGAEAEPTKDDELEEGAGAQEAEEGGIPEGAAEDGSPADVTPGEEGVALEEAIEEEIIKEEGGVELEVSPEEAGDGVAPEEKEAEDVEGIEEEFEEGRKLEEEVAMTEEELATMGLEGEEFGEFFGEEEEMEEMPEGLEPIPEGVEAIPEGVVTGEGLVSEEFEKLDRLLGIIPGHKPSVVLEHQPGTICCLSLKIWAVWLLEIANNAHNWTKWMNDVTKQIRFYVSVIRGDVTLPSGAKRVLHKEEWRKFARETEETVISWRQYSQHVKDLSSEIVDNFHGKPVNCCPKCLQDHLIKNVVTAHETFQALTEAINCAGYWQRCLDKILEQTSKIGGLEMAEEPETTDQKSLQSDESYTVEIEEISAATRPAASQSSCASYYEIEELPVPRAPVSHYEIFEIQPQKIQPPILDIEEIILPNQSNRQSVSDPKPVKNPSATATKPKKSNIKKKK